MGFEVVVHATVILIVAYFILFAASKASGLVRAIGMLLALWVLVLGALCVASMGTLPTSGKGSPFMEMMRQHMGSWMHKPEQAPQPAPAPSPAPTPTPQAQPSPGGATPPKP